MLFAVEGGGFFSSSASGYSKGLTLLLLGQKNKEKPMRVIPWTQYQLVDQETNPDVQLASVKNKPVRRCVCFVCFRRAAAGLEKPSSLKAEHSQNQEVLPENPDFAESKDRSHLVDVVNDDDDNSRVLISIKSSLKKSADSAPVATTADSAPVATSGSSSEGISNDEFELCEEGSEITCQTGRRKVQWNDATGGELYEVREFEMSDDSDDEFNHRKKKTCSCSIM